MLSRKESLPSPWVWNEYFECGVSICSGKRSYISPECGPSHDGSYFTIGGPSGSLKRLRLLHSNSSLPHCVCRPRRYSPEESDGSGCASGTSLRRFSQNQRNDTGARSFSFSAGTT